MVGQNPSVQPKEMHGSTHFLPFSTIDLLDEFEGPSKAATKSSKAGVQGAPKYDSAASVDDDFARQLQLGMQDLLGEIQDSVRGRSEFPDHSLSKSPSA